ncbi:hypothetical protein [Fusobacterium pseudoperiodonticum]|uniref:hypothetical protein n=1 Tax=Fusobacterium pseudoperiodonticum TaxID=2663009 RepID=UPI001F261942|nr:hypothetical protein [Fusobacterium pseudoperiodonticum]
MQDLYFKDTESKLIFGLLELKDRQQLDFLDIDCEHFYDRNAAKNGMRRIKIF